MNRAPGRLALVACLLLGGLLTTRARATDTVVYYHTDALRSVAVVTNATGQVLERTYYAPYGAVLNRPLRDGPGYTGHREDAETGLVYMQQRYYDPETGRFLSADPVQVDDKGGNFNRYWYANGNPYRYTDPDGRYTCDKRVCDAVKSYVVALKQSEESLKANPRTSKEASTVQKALAAIGSEGKGGPHYVAGEVFGQAAAHTDQKGTTTIDVAKIDAAGDKAAQAQAGAQAIGHEVTHDMDVKANNGPITTEIGVRKTEGNAYNTSRAVDRGFGKGWTDKQYDDAVAASVQLWIDNNNEQN